MALFDAHANLAISTVATAPVTPTAGTSLTVASGQGARFSSSGSFNCLAWPANTTPDPSNAEIVRCTRAGDVFTITRAQEGTTAKSIAVGWTFMQIASAKTFTDIEAAFSAYDNPAAGGAPPFSQANLAIEFNAYVPTVHAANDLRIGDTYKHRSTHLWFNNSGGNVTFHSKMYWGQTGVSAAVIADITKTLATGKTYYVTVEVLITNIALNSQTIVVKAEIFDNATGTQVDVLQWITTGAFNTGTTGFHIFVNGLMNVANVNAIFQIWEAHAVAIRMH